MTNQIGACQRCGVEVGDVGEVSDQERREAGGEQLVGQHQVDVAEQATASSAAISYHDACGPSAA